MRILKKSRYSFNLQ